MHAMCTRLFSLLPSKKKKKKKWPRYKASVALTTQEVGGAIVGGACICIVCGLPLGVFLVGAVVCPGPLSITHFRI